MRRLITLLSLALPSTALAGSVTVGAGGDYATVDAALEATDTAELLKVTLLPGDHAAFSVTKAREVQVSGAVGTTTVAGLTVADEGAEVTYMEGCTAPKFSTSTLHSAVVELVALKGAKIQYITVQNWANNVFNLVTKRGIAHEDAEIKWIDCNIGSRLTMKYPGVVLKGERARGEVISIALANDGQHQDTGAKMIHAANNTTSNIVAKSISVGQGRSTYRGVVHIPKHLKGCKNNTECDALLINTNSRTDTYPAISVRGDKNSTQHEASVSKVSEDMIFYMQQRGLTEGQAMSLAVNGFINDLARQFPMEYSVELKRLIDLEMEGSVG